VSYQDQYTVAGMTCAHCVRTVTDTLTALHGVETVEVDLATGKVDIRSERPLERPEVAEAVESAGYSVLA
jgi:copper chaperone CopZ